MLLCVWRLNQENILALGVFEPIAENGPDKERRAYYHDTGTAEPDNTEYDSKHEHKGSQDDNKVQFSIRRSYFRVFSSCGEGLPSSMISTESSSALISCGAVGLFFFMAGNWFSAKVAIFNRLIKRSIQLTN